MMIGPSLSHFSKLLLTLLFGLISWYLYMDVLLYLRIHNYPIDRNYHFNTTILSLPPAISQATSSSSVSNSGYPSSSASNTFTSSGTKRALATSTSINYNRLATNVDYADVVWVPCDINPLCDVTVKAVMLDQTNHYLFAPMATIFDNIVGISRSTWITANMISFFHVFVAILAGRFIASDSLGFRRFGVVLFQFRTFLDDLDGHVARAKKNIRGERSEIGTPGYYIDGICDGLGCIALMIGVFVYLRNNPPRRGYTQLQSIIPMTDAKNSDTGVIYKVKVTTKKVVRKVLCFSGQLLLSSTAWNRYIALYQDMLELNDVTPTQYLRQNFIFKSNHFFCIAWLWRIFNVHALLHCLLLGIFCDKLWEFLRMIQYAGYVAIVVIVCITEMHLLDVQKFIYKQLTPANNTSL
ncbi:ceramide phosphoethanolamine synthase [Culicoides brevitarsis]|uniref:ceramide phosphoethanolamine synthase n=1 Tax=Culicoides brevitarsis TaxID=469753 RepID=UPI00307BECED